MQHRCPSSSWSTTVETERPRSHEISNAADNTESASRPFGGARFVVGAVVFAIGMALIWMSEDVPPPLVRGSISPDFELALLGANEPSSLLDHRGSVVLVNFWATWCKPCEDAEVAAFRDRMGITFPILLDSDESVSRLYQTTGYPESLLVDREGRLVERYVGPREWDDRLYVERIRALLKPPQS
jgi:peroxiredoxin